MSGRVENRWWLTLAIGVLCILLNGCPPPVVNGTNPAGLGIVRMVSQTYSPGDTVGVTVLLTATSGSSITALGLTEVIPDGWSLVSATGPSITPAEGTTGTLEFAWLTTPSFPYQFQYVLAVPREAAGAVSISGSAEYRQTAGPFTVGSVTSGIDPYNPAGVSLERTHPTAYLPGSAVVVTVGIDAEDGSTIAAIGLAETIPTGWSFVSAEGVSADAPDVVPAEGAQGDLAFVWLAVPEFPYTFRYTLIVPEDASGTARLSGYVDYRQDGGPLVTDILHSSLSRAAR